ncbi:MAG: radical SAM family heme chaperone HemW [Oscillospiraceae bacterium]|nr:radical SAM family heme chaperone HemW [Oscillospiraceae bacterium]
MYGIYIHVPFCIRKCPYCDFYSVASSEDLRKEYLLALRNQILSFDRVAADTVYFGGGTPSLLSPEEIAGIIALLRGRFDIEDGAEITMECNPATAGTAEFRGFLDAGVNRLSLGCQSFQEKTLRSLGRLHSADEAKTAVRDAREAGFANISVDLMLGIPFETPEIAERDALAAAELEVQHVSAYLLRICEGTPFAEGVPGIPDDDLQAECYRRFCGVMDAAGYRQYEISNFAVPGYESRHNLKYWQCGHWLGFGPGAHMSDSVRRHSFVPDIRSFIDAFRGGPVPDPLSLMKDEGTVDAEEYIITSLRTSSGLDAGVLQERFGSSLTSEQISFLARCRDAGLAETEGEHIRLTREGFLVSNSILSELI